MRCMHLDRGGRQCPFEALEGKEFCADHSPLIYADGDAEWPEPKTNRPLLYRLAAWILLLIFLLNAYQTLRAWLGR